MLKYRSPMVVSCLGSESRWNYVPIMALSVRKWYVPLVLLASLVLKNLVVEKITRFTIARSLLYPWPSSSRPERARLLWRYLYLTSSLLPRANHHPHRRREGRIFSCARRTHVAAFGYPGLPGILCRRTTTQGDVGYQWF